MRFAVPFVEHHVPTRVLGIEPAPLGGATQVVLPGLVEGSFLCLVANFTFVIA
jgi:hypothetical protein